MITVFGRELSDLVIKSMETDEVTYINQYEKDFAIATIKHFSNMKSWKEFGQIEIDKDTYNKYYKAVTNQSYTEKTNRIKKYKESINYESKRFNIWSWGRKKRR